MSPPAVICKFSNNTSTNNMEFDSQTSLLIALSAVLIFVVVFSAIKGLLRMILLAVAVCCAIVVWMFVQSKGFTLLSCITSTPQPWMVQALAWTAAIFVLVIFFHGLSWFSLLFGLKSGKAGVCNVLTTTLMCILMLWVSTIAVSYYGTISRVSYYHDLAESHYHGAPEPTVPLFTQGKQIIRNAKALAWLESIDPLESPAQSNLACLVAYGCSLSEPEFTRFYNERLTQLKVPHSTRFLELFADAGLRKLVAEGRFVSLLENERLNTFLQFSDTASKLQNINL